MIRHENVQAPQLIRHENTRAAADGMTVLPTGENAPKLR
jgi:hypothetical protein